jgi:dolichol-phosphate mannosyltransferase/undecaprenyl-phosphate 4-deoxy-4-formamido-L-arabinose transferase
MEDKTDYQYTIVIPCYRSENWLEELVSRVDIVMTSIGEPFELILVNDASPDNTWTEIQRVAKKYPFVRAFDMFTNVGQFRALLCGFEHARGQLIITMDDDLQHPPEEIPKLITALKAQPNLDCIMGIPREKKHSRIRNLGSRLMNWLNTVFFNKPPNLKLSSFRLMRRELVIHGICAHPTSKPIIGPLILKSTKRVANTEVKHNQRNHGKSGYSLFKLTLITLDNIFYNSTLPLKFFSIVGLVCSLASIIIAVYFFISYIFGATKVPGFTTPVLLICFFGGTSLFSIGLLGEYVIRILEEVNRPPRYVIRQEINSSI